MSVNCIDLLRSTGAEPRPAARGAKGVEYWSPCPGCGGDDRFHVWPDQNDGDGSWWCRGCGKGGDNIEFCRQFLGMSYHDACEHVGREAADYERSAFYEPPAKTRRREWVPDRKDHPDEVVDPAKWRDQAAKLVAKCHAALLENESVLNYLAGRGLDRAAVERFQLGWLDGENGRTCIFRPRESWGLSTIIKDNGRKRTLFLPRGILIPFHDESGDVCKLRIRRPKADLPENSKNKYFAVPGSAMRFTLINPEARAFAVIEAELDAMAVASLAGDLVGALAVGSSSAKPDAVAAPALEASLAILVALDFDQAGAGAWGWWREHFQQAKRWPVPEGKDPGDAYQAGVDIRAWISAGLPPALTLGPCRFGKPGERGGADDVRDDEGHGENCADAVPQVQDGNQGDEFRRNYDPLREADGSVVSEVDSNDRSIETPVEKELPPSVVELASLLKRYPVRIINRPEQTGVREKMAMRRHPDVSKRISNLLFFDKACWDHVAAHPAEVVDGSNFLDVISNN